ncbi:MAG: hypothetical protein WB611_20355, partial [Stellaceae bacterium]
LRLKHECGATDRAIARSLGIARSTVAVTLDRLAAADLCWPLPATLSDRVLEAMLYAGPGTQRGSRRKAEPDWTHVHHELRRPGVTLMLLWEEYRPAGDPPPRPTSIGTAGRLRSEQVADFNRNARPASSESAPTQQAEARKRRAQGQPRRYYERQCLLNFVLRRPGPPEPVARLRRDNTGFAIGFRSAPLSRFAWRDGGRLGHCIYEEEEEQTSAINGMIDDALYNFATLANSAESSMAVDSRGFQSGTAISAA